MSEWSARYRDSIRRHPDVAAYLQYKIKYKLPLVERILRNAGSTGRVLETGCGAATTSLYLASLGYTVTGIDSDLEMLSLASELAADLGHDARFLRMDIRSLEFPESSFDVAFSNGVLEHFSDDEIKRILIATTRIASTLVFAVPTDYFDDSQRVHGDERFMSVSHWRCLIADAGCAIQEEFGFLFASALRERVHRWTFGRLPKAPFAGFVVRRR